MTVQDDERERELVRLFNLKWDPAHQRAGVDAVLPLTIGETDHVLEVEVKSTTGSTVSTARDVGMDHIGKWRSKLFIIGFYSKEARRPELLRSLCLTPADMAPWIDAIEAKIAVDFRIAEKSSRALTENDLADVCGAKAHYTLSDARSVLKQQWSVLQYAQAADMSLDKRPVYSPTAMLHILQRRALYIAQRGATLNNPHITKTHLARFFGTDREITTDWAQSVRAVAKHWLQTSVGA